MTKTGRKRDNKELREEKRGRRYDGEERRRGRRKGEEGGEGSNNDPISVHILTTILWAKRRASC